MISLILQTYLRDFISTETGIPVSSFDIFTVEGGSINRTYQLVINKKDKLFCKINSVSRFPKMFEKEGSGLKLLASKRLIRVPEVLGTFVFEGEQVLVLQWIEVGRKDGDFWKTFGEQMAALHGVRYTHAGLIEDNYMGALPQSNTQSNDWIDFFIRERLEPQVRLALDKKLLQPQHLKKFGQLYLSLPGIFPNDQFALLHGDLWSGNFLCDDQGIPVLIDPAVYQGYPGMDIAMTTLFGGFDRGFYESYNYMLPFPPNHKQQWEICNLYPLLIHLNLFGKSYLQNIIASIQYY